MKTQRIIPKKLSAKARVQIWHNLRKRMDTTIYLDGILSSLGGKIHIDIFRLEKQIPNYNGEKCEYKGKKNYSMSMAIEEEWGKEVMELIKSIL